MDIIKQIEYWRGSAIDNLETSEILIEKNKYKEGLFFCHLSIEKILKAHFVRCNNNFAPKTHNLLYLLSKTDIKVDTDIEKFLIEIMDYQLEGRYPEHQPDIPSKEVAFIFFHKTQELIQWLIKKF